MLDDSATAAIHDDITQDDPYLAVRITTAMDWPIRRRSRPVLDGPTMVL